MASRIVRTAVVGLLLLLTTQQLTQARVVEAGELGIGVEILATESADPAQLGANSELWFAIEPGATAQRKFRIVSTSEIIQQVSFELWQLIVVDGERTIDRTERSPSEPWLSFSPSTLELEPRGRQEVTMTYTIPADTEPAVYESYLRILVAAGEAPVQESSDAGVQAVVKGALAFRKSVWLGVGDASSLLTDFEIRNAAGWLTDGGDKAVRLLLANTGGTPIRLDGTVQLADALFPDNSFGPFEFGTNIILPGESAYADAVVDASISDGRWSVFVQATQGSIRKTARFEKDLRFDRSLDEFGSRWAWFVRAAVGVVGTVFVLAGYVLMRGRGQRSRKRRRRGGLRLRSAARGRRKPKDTSEPPVLLSDARRRAQALRQAEMKRLTTEIETLSLDGASETALGDRLRELRDLLDDGLISEEEFEGKKNEILKRF
jgi:hypothetical protein